jgi:hypothetical protein
MQQAILQIIKNKHHAGTVVAAKMALCGGPRRLVFGPKLLNRMTRASPLLQKL